MSASAPEDRWWRADRLLDQALDLPAGERHAFLDAACAGDAELRALVGRLLAGAKVELPTLSPGGGLRMLEELRAAAAGSPPEETGLAGTVVGGRYRIVRELGRGGMAVVYLAERIDDFEQQVALKLLQRGLEGDEAVARFEQERQILAAARHPGIARLLDGGVGPGGRPYLAMEHVEGRPIDRYCDEERLSVAARVRLFLQVARAIEAAHRNLIVHRDIKPSNILVTADGHAKLLDFGIAKLLGPAAGTTAPVTRATMRLLTPAFGSPEQVLGGPITTASDVYQLGLLLYLLLAGRLPHRATGRPDEVARAIVAEQPTRPSTAVRTAVETVAEAGVRSAEQVAGARDTTLPRLRRALAGDLDAIVLTALRKEPERRYGSVGQMIDDLERYLAGRPIAVRADSWAYRTSKFVRRHLGAVATAAAAIVLVAVLAVAYASQLARERDRARLAAARAEQTAAFLRGLFEVAAPVRSRGEQVTARQLLDRGATRIDAELADQPELAADLMTLMGDVYRELALNDEARVLLERAVALRRGRMEESGRPGPASLDLAASLATLARVRAEAAQHAPARALYEEALALRQAALGPDHPDVGRTLEGLGAVLLAQGDFQGARQRLQRALAILEKSLGPRHPEVGLALLNYGRLLRRHADAGALPLLERALEVLQAGYGADHPYVANARVELAHELRDSGQLAAARTQYEQALPVLERAYGPSHPVVANTLASLADMTLEEGDAAAAIAQQRRVLTLREAALGPDHPQVAASWNALGKAYRKQGNRAEARRCFEKSAEVYVRTLGPAHPDLANPLNNIAETLRDEGRYAAARPFYERALAIREKSLGPRHINLVMPLFNLGRIDRELGEPARAEAELRRAIGLTVGQGDAEHGADLMKVELARTLVTLGKLGEAEALLAPLLKSDAGEPVRSRAREAWSELRRAGGGRPAAGAPAVK